MASGFRFRDGSRSPSDSVTNMREPMTNRTSTTTRGTLRACLIASLAGVVTMGCTGLLDVNNPNNVTGESLENPVAAPSILNGAENSTTRALASIYTPYAGATDETIFVGSRDDYQQLNQGQVGNPSNEYINGNSFNVNEARWLADNAIKLLEGFKKAGKLTDNTLIARAYLNGAVIYTTIADMFDDFTISDRTVAAPPVTEARMSVLYDSATLYLDRALPLSSGNQRTTVLAMRARVKHAKGMWAKLNPVPAAPTNPLVADNGYVADAQAALTAMAGTTFRYDLLPTSENAGGWGFELNSRIELTPSPFFATLNKTNTVDKIVVKDPVANVIDPFAVERINATTKPAQPNNIPMRIVSSEEMYLLLAEGALAAANNAGFDTQINALRATVGLPPYTGSGVTRLQLLEHERRVALLFEGRRLNDMYRFGVKSPTWNVNSTAVKQPGCAFPIGISERESNPFLHDSAKPYQPVCK
jgi:starch-binding outer membrane protein, SusD/RagB family